MKIKVEYNGRYPNLCSGDLTVIIDGKKWKFPSHCLSSGGSVTFDKNWSEEVTEGPWSVSQWPPRFPKKLMEPVTAAINASITWGCCGGCV